jgi:uncharacterized protein
MESTLPVLLQRLLDPAFYPHDVAQVRLVQTHSAYVFLTGTYAYKVKKPVNFGFLDYSTLEKREHFLKEELRLNQRLAPQIYRDVLPIQEDGDGYHLGNTGEPGVEYTLRMVEFPQSQLLSNLFAEGGVTLAHMEQLGRQVADFHHQALTNSDIQQFGIPERARIPIDQNYSQSAGYVGRAQTETQLTETQSFTDNFFSTQTKLLQERVVTGKIREGHGDLHLGNICLLDNTPVVFDCIEFNEPFRFIDVLSDAGFLVMDLIARKRSDLAYRFLNTYLEWTGDWSGLPLLPVYLSYRAYVRAKVTSFLLDDPNVGVEQKEEARIGAAAYYQLAWQFTQPAKAKLFIMQGVSGSGKSTVAKELATHIQAIHLRSDAVRKHLARLPLLDKLPPEFYTAAFSQRTYEQLLTLATILLKAGFSVILDAKYDTVHQRIAALTVAQQLGVPAKILACRCPETSLTDRLNQRTGDIADADASLMAAQKEAQEEFSPAEIEKVLFLNTEVPLGWDIIGS